MIHYNLTDEQRINLEELCAVLRSGEYAQAEGKLRKEDTFCCLGVACDLSAKRGIGEWVPTNNGDADTCTHILPFNTHLFSLPLAHLEESRNDVLPVAIQKLFGLSDNGSFSKKWPGGNTVGLYNEDDTEDLTDKKVRTCLSELNDKGASFNEIADIIEVIFLETKHKLPDGWKLGYDLLNKNSMYNYTQIEVSLEEYRALSFE